MNAITSHGDVVYFTNFPSGKVEIIRYNIGDETTTTSTTTFSKTTDTNNSAVTSGFEVFSLITALILLLAFSKKSPNNQ